MSEKSRKMEDVENMLKITCLHTIGKKLQNYKENFSFGSFVAPAFSSDISIDVSVSTSSENSSEREQIYGSCKQTSVSAAQVYIISMMFFLETSGSKF